MTKEKDAVSRLLETQWRLCRLSGRWHEWKEVFLYSRARRDFIETRGPVRKEGSQSGKVTSIIPFCKVRSYRMFRPSINSFGKVRLCVI